MFLLIRSMQLVIPFPFGKFAYLLVTDQIPRYFLFVGWQLLAFWIGSAIISSFSKSSVYRKCLAVSFIILFILLLIASIIVTFVTAVWIFFII